MKIFGIGLSRTGTLSLAKALQHLGYSSKHYPRPSLLPKLKKVTDKHDACTDTPIALAYKDLDELYPNSKFILTTRSYKSWIRSCKNFKHFRIKLKGERKEIRMRLYGLNGFDEEKFRKAYVKHHREVRNHFKNRNEDLLIMDITAGDGWEKLCNFLGEKIPECEFPHEHRSSY